MSDLELDPKVHYIFRVIEVVNLNITDFSALTSISRNSLYRWKRGGSITDSLRLDIAYRTAIRLDKARKLEILPLTDPLKKAKRIRVLRKIVSDMSRK